METFDQMKERWEREKTPQDVRLKEAHEFQDAYFERIKVAKELVEKSKQSSEKILKSMNRISWVLWVLLAGLIASQVIKAGIHFGWWKSLFGG
jgi:hypothetical protein